ncbi:MAG TPA: chemotaxis protein CheB [Cyanobacteria bacterium UBA11369]|nr:chemotaxis protein CheB [Cyanobacteria bacterium UBA11371]HBE36733.1 chemotaxis protein CheB [Cyanobacteria bacterium UBA11368]HBE52201.1 chemotaxis protein CheB [Cyanobacteria bacterium UBA11369]
MTSLIQIPEHRIFSHFPNIAFNVVALAASMGGLKAISAVLSALPADFPAAILVVQHLCPKFPSQMAEILSQRTALRVKLAAIGDVVRPGTVYVAPPDQHLLVAPNGTLLLSDTPKMNFARPAADKLFMSVASTYKSRAIAVVLTGKGSDGALGVLSIKKHGGMAIAQDESTSEFFNMPGAAIATGKVDLVLPLDAIASTLVHVVREQFAVTPRQRRGVTARYFSLGNVSLTMSTL